MRSCRCTPCTLTSHMIGTLLRVSVQNISSGDRWLQPVFYIVWRSSVSSLSFVVMRRRDQLPQCQRPLCSRFYPVGKLTASSSSGLRCFSSLPLDQQSSLSAFSFMFAVRVGADCIGLDLSQEMVLAAMHEIGRMGVKVRANVCKVESSGSRWIFRHE